MSEKKLSSDELLREVLEEILEKKGIKKDSEEYETEKKRVGELLYDKMAEARMEALLTGDKKKVMELMEKNPDDTEAIEKILNESEIKTEVLVKAVIDFQKDYLEGRI